MRVRALENVQHCRSCATEFHAWVHVCSDCGGRLEPGPLPTPTERHAATLEAESNPVLPPADSLLMELPGALAHRAARALALEGIPSVLECEGLVQVHAPGAPECGPLAVTLPVAIYVADADQSRAHEIVGAVVESEAAGDARLAEVSAAELEAEAVRDARSDATVDGIPSNPHVPKPDSAIGRVLLLLVALFLLLMFVSAR